MIVRTLEHQRTQEQKRFRMLHLLLQGVHLSIGASGAAQIKNIPAVQRAFQAFLNNLLDMGQPPGPDPKLSLAAVKFKYGSRWIEHLDEVSEEDRDHIDST